MNEFVPVKRAILSVYDKSGIVELARQLLGFGVELISTGGTATCLKDAGLPVTTVSELTGYPEIMEGRVKSLHPAIHGALLALRDNEEHIKDMTQCDIAPIDLAIINLYPFETVVLKASGDAALCCENIDIGGPAIIRAGAKNYRHVTVVVEPDDYSSLLQELEKYNGATSLNFRQYCAQNAFARTSAYDSQISNWIARRAGIQFPKRRTFSATLYKVLRYGENPHQKAQFYVSDSKSHAALLPRQIQGKELSFNNLLDTDAACRLIAEFPSNEGAACVIVKHTNPCGVAKKDTQVEAYNCALRCDNQAAFGGIIAFNTPLNEETARQILKTFVEVVIAPGIEEGVECIFAEKPNIRLLLVNAGVAKTWQSADADYVTNIAQISDGYLVQDEDIKTISENDLRNVTCRSASASEVADMLFAWKVAKHVASNAIVIARNQETYGIGAGQMSRIDAVRIASQKTLARLSIQKASMLSQEDNGLVLASDAFFPFPDSLEEAAKIKVSSIIQPGGSQRDQEVIAAANERNITMMFTGVRHFKH